MFNKVNSKIISLMLSALFLAASSQAHAQVNGENIIFAGSGSGKDADSKAYSIGYLRVSNSTDRVWA